MINYRFLNEYIGGRLIILDLYYYRNGSGLFYWNRILICFLCYLCFVKIIIWKFVESFIYYYIVLFSIIFDYGIYFDLK